MSEKKAKTKATRAGKPQRKREKRPGELVEEFILAHLAGDSNTEIARKYDTTRSTVVKHLNANKHRIEAIKEERRQKAEEALAEAFEKERETITRLITKTGILAEKLLDESIEWYEYRSLQKEWQESMLPVNADEAEDMQNQGDEHLYWQRLKKKLTPKSYTEGKSFEQGSYWKGEYSEPLSTAETLKLFKTVRDVVISFQKMSQEVK